MIAMLALVAMTAAQPLPPVGRFLQEFDRKRANVKALKADFTQVDRNGGDSETVHGSIFYAYPRRIIFRYPESRLIYIFDDQQIYEYDEAAQQVQMQDLENDPQTQALFLGFGEDTSRLKRAYDIELFRPDPSQCGTIGMILRPKRDRIKRSPFKEVRLYLSGASFLPCRVKIVNDQDSTVVIDVTNLRVNPSFTPRDTQVKVAPGTDVFRNDQPFGKAGAKGMWLPSQPIEPSAAALAPNKAAATP